MGSTSPPPRWVVVDDSDTSVRFDGPAWFTTNDAMENFGNFGPTYQSTLHGTNTSAQLSFTFDGSAVTLWGSNNPRNRSGIIDPEWDCLIDGVSFGPTEPFRFPENNWVFCEWRDGLPGEHTLTVRATTEGQTFWVDRVEYVPSPDAEVAGGSVISVNHMDNAIKLGQGWNALGGTANFTQTRGTTAEVEFIGTKLSWWGFVPGEFRKTPTTASYAIDGGPPKSFALKGLADDQGTTYNQKFFETPLLSPGPHRLLVIHQGNSQTTPLTLTNLLIDGGNFTAPLPGDPSIFAAGSSSSSSSIPSATSSDSPGGGSNTPIGAIVGGVVGGLAMIIATAVIAFFLIRKRKARGTAEEQAQAVPYVSPSHPPMHVANTTTPIYGVYHTVPQNEHQPQNPTHRSMPSGATDQWTYDPPSSLGHRPLGSPPAHAQATVTSGSLPSPPLSVTNTSSGMSATRSNVATSGHPVHVEPLRKGQLVALDSARNQGIPYTSDPARVVLHEDSGIRMDERGNMIEVPPLYTPQ